MRGNPSGFLSSPVGFADGLLAFRGWDLLNWSLVATIRWIELRRVAAGVNPAAHALLG